MLSRRHAAVLVTEMSQSVKATCQSAVDTATDVLSAVVVDPDLLSVFDSVIGRLHTLESSLASLSSVNQSVDALRLIAENNLKSVSLMVCPCPISS